MAYVCHQCIDELRLELTHYSNKLQHLRSQTTQKKGRRMSMSFMGNPEKKAERNEDKKHHIIDEVGEHAVVVTGDTATRRLATHCAHTLSHR